MASVNWAHYTIVDPLNPGQSRVLTFRETETNPFTWFGKALSVSILPDRLPSIDLPPGGAFFRAIEVTGVVYRTEGTSEILQTLVDITYQNRGSDPIPYYDVFLGLISE